MGERHILSPSPFRRGYLVTNYAAPPPRLGGWSTVHLDQLTFHLHPETQWAVARRGPLAVAVIGQAIDIDHGDTSPERIARRLLGRLAAANLQAAIRDAAYLGGRATYVLQTAESTVFVPDLAGSHPIYWHHCDGRLAVSNYAHLVGEVAAAELNERFIDLMRRARDLGARRTIYWPGIETPFLGVNPVIPNHALRLSTERAPQHERFYPFPDTDLDRDPERAYLRFKDVFSEHVRLICSLDPHVGISLTAGVDSQATLWAAVPHLLRDTTRTWTYLNSARPHEGMAADAEAAAQISNELGLQHVVVDLALSGGSCPRAAAFHGAVQKSMRHTAQMRSVPYAYAAQLPQETLEMMSIVAEYGTGFYKNRKGAPEVARLSELYQLSDFGKNELVQEAFETFMEYTGFADVESGPVDWHDLFYAEHRLARWASVRVQEVELVHRVQLPFNSRASTEALLGLPLPDRVEKQAQRRLIAEGSQSGARVGARAQSALKRRWRALAARSAGGLS